MLAPNPSRSNFVFSKSDLRRIALSITILFTTFFCVLAQTYQTTGSSNNWNDPAAWTCQGGGCKSTPGTKLTGKAKVIIVDSVSLDANLQLINAQLFIEDGGRLHLIDSDLNVENNKNKGSVILNRGIIYVDGSWENRGIVELTISKIVVDSYVLNDQKIDLDSSCVYVQGDFQNAGDLTGQGFLKASGDVSNQGVWSSQIPYCLDGTLTGTINAVEDCEAGAFCACLPDPCAIPNPDIEPGVNSVLKVDSIIGPFLTGLNQGLTEDGLQEDVFVFGEEGEVCVDIFVHQYSAVVTLLNSTYGITDFLPGSNQRVITVFFPVANLDELNRRSDIIRYVSATPVGRTDANSTLPNQGDFAQESFFARAGYDISGAGVKIGVLSDSYDMGSSFGNQPAQNDIDGGVLPGNPGVGSENPTPVQVLTEYPSPASDEGRGMLQIVHSVAPQAELYFHTAFISPQSFAEGIKALRDADCDIIVDDVTYISESFYGKGVVAKAVADVVNNSGVAYLTSAGNFADRAFSSTFNTTDGNKHDFQGGDYLQGLTLEPGDYLLVLQWDDDNFSAGGAGASVDLDVYLADDNGNKIYGFNRNNIGGDAVEIMPFSVVSSGAATTNLLIENGGPTNAQGMAIKYVVFKAGGGIAQTGFSAEYYSGGSTVVGHANTPEAMTVGAVRYTNTPTYGGTLQSEAFSSVGEGSKPDFTAPNGANVTIELGNDTDNDGLPNFFGTSAAAPHAAGVCALLLEAQDKFGTSFDLRTKLSSTATPYGESANKMGAGFISAFNALESFANPLPSISKLDLSGLGANPSDGGTLIIEGEFFNDQTQVFLRDDLLEVQPGSTDSTLIVIIPPFNGNPPIWVFNPALANGDGGADTAYTEDPVILEVDIITNSIAKKYGEALPALSFTTNNAELNADPILLGLLTEAVNLTTTATNSSDVGAYAINASWDEASLNVALRELYTFNLGEVGFVTVDPLPVTVVPQSITSTYGDALPPIRFDYLFPDGIDIVDEATLAGQLEADHLSSIAPDLAVLVNLSLANLSLANLSLANRAFLASLRSTIPNLSLANLSLANGMEIIEVDARLFNENGNSNFTNGTDFIGNLSLVNFLSLANGRAFQTSTLGEDPELNLSLANLSLANLSLANYSEIENISNLSLANLSLANFLSLANLSLANLSLANGTSVIDFTLPLRNFLSLANGDNTGMVTILTPADIEAPGTDGVPLVPVNFVTGLDAGPQKIVPAAFLSSELSKNFIVSYEEGDLTILPAPLSLTVADTAITYGESLPGFRVIDDALLLDDSIPEVVSGFTVASSSGGTYNGDAGSYQVSPVLTDNTNYNVIITNGILTVDKADLSVTVAPANRDFGQDNPDFQLAYSGFLGDDTEADIDAAPSVSTSAVCDSPVGSYATTVVGGSDNNYSFISVDGVLTVEPSILTITAIDQLINENENPDYSFETSTEVCGSLLTESIADPNLITGSLDPSFNGAGSYTITPVLVNYDASNYIVELVPGTLLVNPVVGCNDKIKASDLCNEDVSETIDGITYTTRLTFEYTNALEVPIYVAVGSDNFFKTKGNVDYLGDPPSIFEPGVHTFSILTDGGDVQWLIKTPGCNNSDKSPNGSQADPCSSGSSARSAGKQRFVAADAVELNVFPSPFVDRFNLRMKGLETSAEVKLYSTSGQLVQDLGLQEVRYGVEVDAHDLPRGIFYVQVVSGEIKRIAKIVKL